MNVVMSMLQQDGCLIANRSGCISALSDLQLRWLLKPLGGPNKSREASCKG